MNERTNMLANQGIGKLLFNLSVPAIVGMLVQALYNLTDTIFIGRGLGDEGVLGIGGIAIAFPIQMIIMASALTVGIGGSSIISRALGAKDHELAEKTLGNMITMIFIISGFVTFFGSIYIIPILKLFGATDTLLPYSLDYLSVIFYGTIFFAFSISINNVLRAEGNARDAMIVMILSGVLNIILDPVFIFGFHMGVMGAALATIISQFVGSIYILRYFVSGRSVLAVKFRNLKLQYGIIKEMIAIGISGFVRQSSTSIMVVILNHNLAFYGGDIAIAVFGVINRLQMIIFMPIIGTVQGMQPIVGFNYGAGNYKRVRDAILLSIKVTTGISVFGFFVMLLFARPLFSIFSTDQQLIDMGTFALRIIVIAFPFVGYQVVGSAFYQSIGKARPSLLLSMTRQLIFLIPLVIILPVFFGLNGIWTAFPLADLMAFCLTYYILSKELRSLNV